MDFLYATSIVFCTLLMIRSVETKDYFIGRRMTENVLEHSHFRFCFVKTWKTLLPGKIRYNIF